jgi:hypothetical protein
MFDAPAFPLLVLFGQHKITFRQELIMKTILAVALVATATIAAASSADARDGCGQGAHRGAYGHCRPNHGYDRGYHRGDDRRHYRGDDRVVIGTYYGDRGGYWDGNRYWMHRDRFEGGWRYR